MQLNASQVESIVRDVLAQMAGHTTEQSAPATPEQTKQEPVRGWEAMSLLHDLVYLLAILTIVFTFFIRLVAVSGSSMYPTLVDKDYLVLESNFLYRDVKAGDIVVLKTDYFNEPIVKRSWTARSSSASLQPAGRPSISILHRALSMSMAWRLRKPTLTSRPIRAILNTGWDWTIR